MAEAVAETYEPETYPRTAPSWLTEWGGKEILSRLERRSSLLPGIQSDLVSPNFADSAVEGERLVRSDFWKKRISYVEVEIQLITENSTRTRRGHDEAILAYLAAEALLPAEVTEDPDLLDWDAHVAAPPPARHSGRIKARFKYRGRSKPILS